MEILRKNVHMNRQKAQVVSQITLDNDFNVPDIKPDIDKLILDQGEIQIEEVRPEKDRITVKGTLQVQLLYVAEGGSMQPQSLELPLPFEETIHIEGLVTGDGLKVDWNIEDLNVSAIHSRKISVRSIVTFTVTVETVFDAELAKGLPEQEDVQTLTKELEMLCLVMDRKDTLRVREEVMLAANQANIMELLWKEACLQGVELRLLEGKLSIKGELAMFVLYEGENEEQPQWVSSVTPFAGMLDLSGCRPEFIHDIHVHVAQKKIEIKPDYDGEERLIQAELLLELDIRLYEEMKTTVLTDAYSVSKELNLVCDKVKLDRLLLKNFSKARYSEKIRVKAEELPVLQLCFTQGKLLIEEIRMVPEGVIVEGIILAQVFYITSNDRIPICRGKGGIPFSHTLEVPGIEKGCVYSLKGDLEQISAVMVDSQDAEIRATVNFHLLVRKPMECENVINIEEMPLDYEKLNGLPGVVGCIMGEDMTLWDIAKKYYTTVDHICQTNSFNEKEARPGDKLLILKSVGTL